MVARGKPCLMQSRIPRNSGGAAKAFWQQKAQINEPTDAQHRRVESKESS
jgi:hypothetical protein